MARQFIYTLRDVRKVHPGGKEVLKGINLYFYPGAKIGVLGSNGSGKSSLMRIMAGVDKALAIDSKSARNLYYAGLVARKQGDDAKAKDFFERSLKVPCSTPADNDVCAAYRREAKKGIEVTSK